jgi:CubicO group peptidase (beta-lactamase class C family)
VTRPPGTTCILLCALWANSFTCGATPEPVFPTETWDTLAPDAVGLDRATLDRLAEHVGGRGCVVRHGYLVYAWGDITEARDVASAFKPVLSTLLFFAVQDGLITSPHAPVAGHEPRLLELNADKDGRITWKQLAQQTSGYGLAEPPGTAYSYNDHAITLYYDTLMNRVFQTHGNQVLNRYLAGPLSFQDPASFEAFGPRDRPGRLAISSRDFARFGLFILRHGRWADRQLLDPAHIDTMLNSILPADTPITGGQEAPMLDGQRSLGGGRTITQVGPGFYSYNWWRNGIDRNGHRLYVDGPEDLLLAGGHGGRRNLWIFPSLDLIVVWNDSRITDHDESPGNPDTLSNQAVRIILTAFTGNPDEPPQTRPAANLDPR